jgi:hypothetical protein
MGRLKDEMNEEPSTLSRIRFFRQEMLRLYPDAEATMGEARLVGETGPDNAGKYLSPTTVKVRFPPVQFIFSAAYIFHRKLMETNTQRGDNNFVWNTDCTWIMCKK